jgi:predicted Zn finger-like uncharacterized protein
MNVSCPSCATVYRVDPAKVPPVGVRARCQVCAAVFPVRRSAEVEEAPRPVAMSVPAAPLAPPPRITAPAQMPAVEEPPLPRPAPAPEPEPAAEPVPEVPRATEPRLPPPAGRPVMAAPALPPVRPNVPPRPAPPASPAPPFVRPTIANPPAAPPPARPMAPASTPAAAPGRPANPFLNQDPGQKARRLARALVSDLAVYFPDRRKKALASGTLKQEFEEEIRKSWEEYTDQVGKDLADASSHFNDALNEILAGGQKIF